MRLVHLTDTHLAHLSAETAVEQFGRKVRAEADPDMIVITGDVATYGSLGRCFDQFYEGVRCPIKFVLGNHDVHGLTWAQARDHARALCASRPWLQYLDAKQLSSPAPNVALVGCDGWYDGRCGSRDETDRSLKMCGDLFWVTNTHTLVKAGKKGQMTAAKVAREYADKMVDESRQTLRWALSKGFRRVFFATHVPPFEESAWHLSAPSDNNWLPIMVCKAMGEMLLKEAAMNLDRQIDVLCGHTHTARRFEAASNLTVYTGHSGAKDYGEPGVSNWFDLEE